MSKHRHGLFSTRRRLPLRPWMPYALLALGCLLSVAVAWYMSSTADARAQTKFLTDAAETRRQIQGRLNTYSDVVRAAAALLTANNEISHAEFRGFVRGLQLRERYPGIQGIGFSQHVRRRELRTFLRAMDLDGVARFRIWPAGDRPEFDTVIFLEPMDRLNQAAVGFDLSTDAVLQAALERARDSGQPTASRRLTLNQPFEDGWQARVVLCIPVYRTRQAVQTTVEDRRRALIGFVFSPFNVAELLQDVAAISSVTFGVYEGIDPSPTALLSQSASVTSPARYQSAEAVQIAGRDWLVAARSAAAPASRMPEAAQRVLITGLLLSLMLFIITRAQVHAWEAVARQAAELRASEEALRASEAELRRMVVLEREARSRAQMADRAKDEFLAILSHELRTPLNAVLGWLSMLRAGSLREERRAHAVEVIERNARLQADLIDDLLDVSRIVQGKVRLELSPIDIAPIVSAVVESLRPSAVAKGVDLHAPPATDAVTIRGDSGRVQQVVWNLVSNALKFTPAGGHVSVELASDNHHVHLSVRDTGVGIEPEFLPHVFERFRQADSSTTRPHSGVGLGLAIVHHLVQLHGGSIEARSEGRDRGAQFVVHFPLAAATTSPSPVALVASEPLPTAVLDGLRVLVVDDDQDTRELLTEALNTMGARVTSADSARAAFGLLSEDSADVLVSDIAMAEEDGLSLMRRVRALPGEVGRIPAIALTALARADDRARAIEAGYQVHLAKPVELTELQAELARLAAHHRV